MTKSVVVKNQADVFMNRACCGRGSTPRHCRCKRDTITTHLRYYQFFLFCVHSSASRSDARACGLTCNKRLHPTLCLKKKLNFFCSFLVFCRIEMGGGVREGKTAMTWRGFPADLDKRNELASGSTDPKTLCPEDKA